MNKISLDFNGKKIEGYAQTIQGRLWVHIKGNTYTFEGTRGTRKRRSVEGKSSSTLITAPMPGKITRIFVEEGQTIELGQAVVVMEAMKMEYTLKSELATSIEKINVKVGDQVQLGQMLLKLKEI